MKIDISEIIIRTIGPRNLDTTFVAAMAFEVMRDEGWVKWLIDCPNQQFKHKLKYLERAEYIEAQEAALRNTPKVVVLVDNSCVHLPEPEDNMIYVYIDTGVVDLEIGGHMGHVIQRGFDKWGLKDVVLESPLYKIQNFEDYLPGASKMRHPLPLPPRLAAKVFDVSVELIVKEHQEDPTEFEVEKYTYFRQEQFV